MSTTVSQDESAPAIQGRQPVSRRYLAGGELCLEVIAVPGLLDAATTALAEYARTLSVREQNGLSSVPQSMRSPCYLAQHIHAPARHLEDGLPIQESDGAGYHRSLVDFDASVQVPATLFSLPPGYTAFTIN